MSTIEIMFGMSIFIECPPSLVSVYYNQVLFFVQSGTFLCRESGTKEVTIIENDNMVIKIFKLNGREVKREKYIDDIMTEKSVDKQQVDIGTKVKKLKRTADGKVATT